MDGQAGALSPRDRVVLSALALRPGQVSSAERLADAIWGDELPASWEKIVQGCVVRLRKRLGPAAIETVPQGYRLAVPADSVDSRRFEGMLARARELLTLGEPERAAFVYDEALAIWRGHPHSDLEEWEPGRIESERLEELHRDAEEGRVEAYVRAGRAAHVLADAQSLVSAQPLREHRWAILALAQYQAGRQAEALGTLQRARTLLVRELGLDPGPELVALERSILQQDPGLAVDAVSSSSGDSCPYRGLVPYDVSDADSFFGRAGELEACLGVLSDTGVLAIVGPSGSGKSSLTRAGVAAALIERGHAVVVLTPGPQPADLTSRIVRCDRAAVIVVDQCEDLLAAPDRQAVEGFLDELVLHAANAPVVVAIRADRLGDLSLHAGLARLVERGLHLLGPMDEADLRSAIEGPARQAGLLLEPGLIDLLVREVEGEPGALPLLSHALLQTWLAREGRVLTVEGYRSSGGIRGAVAQTAESVYESVPLWQRTAMRDLLLRLVVQSSDGTPVGGRVSRTALAPDPEHEALLEKLVTRAAADGRRGPHRARARVVGACLAPVPVVAGRRRRGAAHPAAPVGVG